MSEPEKKKKKRAKQRTRGKRSDSRDPQAEDRARNLAKYEERARRGEPLFGHDERRGA